MLCKVDGCSTNAMYTAQCVCQKHYFRFMRTGSYELRTKTPFQDARGYWFISDKDHPLAQQNGCVAEHRRVVYAKHGDNLPDCQLCGSPVDWATCHIDHVDENPSNNDPENLRAVCRGCNTSRTQRSTIERYDYAGLRLSLLKWSKQPGVTGTVAVLKRRIKSGMTIEQALFARNKTHPKPTWSAA